MSPNKNWFGVLFAVPVANPLLCPAIEAELISELTEADVVDVIANVNEERRLQAVEDVHVEPAVEEIRDGLQLLLGSDIFIAREPDVGETDPPLDRVTPLARVYKGRASRPRNRAGDEPPEATHTWVGGLGLTGWGRFEADEPDTRFRVLAGSGWRRASVNLDAITHAAQQRVREDQDQLIQAGVLNEAAMTFKSDHVFDNWTRASRVVAGKPATSGIFRWALLK